MFRHMNLVYVVDITEQVRGRRGRDHMIVGFIATYAISAIVISNLVQTRCTRYNIM